MGLATRIIPTLLCRSSQLVKGSQFNPWRVVGHAAQAVRVHQARGVDELVLLDVLATRENRGPDLQMVSELTASCFMPLAVGGGVRSLSDVRALLNAGADKVVIGRHALGPDSPVYAVARAYGCQAVVVALNVWKAGVPTSVDMNVKWIPPEVAARQAAAMGAGEILLTCVEREGTGVGYDEELIRSVVEAVDIPVVAHGGCGTPEHMLKAIQAGADAVAAGAMFQFTETTPRDAAQYLAAAGVEVRI